MICHLSARCFLSTSSCKNHCSKLTFNGPTTLGSKTKHYASLAAHPLPPESKGLISFNNPSNTRLWNGSCEGARCTQPTVRPGRRQRLAALRWTAFQAIILPTKTVPGTRFTLESADSRATRWARNPAVRMFCPFCPEHQSPSLTEATVQWLPLRHKERKAASGVYKKAKAQAATGVMTGCEPCDFQLNSPLIKLHQCFLM